MLERQTQRHIKKRELINRKINRLVIYNLSTDGEMCLGDMVERQGYKECSIANFTDKIMI